MRVDACTNEVKECLTAEDRCGEDYTQCIGLDTDTIVRMCPFEKLVACADRYKKETQDDDENASKVKDINEYEDEVYNYVADIAQGIFLNIDNNFMTECQNALDDAMIKVCGDTENCDNMTVDDGIGTRSLEYKICEYKDNVFTNCRTDVKQIPDEELGLGEDCVIKDGKEECTERIPRIFASKIFGEIPWENIDFVNEQSNEKFDTDYGMGWDLSNAEIDADYKDKVESELNQLKRNISLVVDTIEIDPTVQYCMTGRQVQGMVVRDAEGKATNKAARGQRDGELEKIGKATGEGAGRFPQLTQQIRGIIATSALRKAKENYMKKFDKMNEQKAQDYVTIGERIAKNKKENALNARRYSGRLSCLNMAKGGVLPSSQSFRHGDFDPQTAEMSASNSSEDPQYKETVTTTFNWETLICTKCVRSQSCSNFKKKAIRKKSYCKEWEPVKENCKDVQF